MALETFFPVFPKQGSLDSPAVDPSLVHLQLTRTEKSGFVLARSLCRWPLLVSYCAKLSNFLKESSISHHKSHSFRPNRRAFLGLSLVASAAVVLGACPTNPAAGVVPRILPAGGEHVYDLTRFHPGTY